MQAEELIRKSHWWLEAQQMPDRHHAESEGVTLADHLQRVHTILRLVLSPDGLDGYFAELRGALVNAGLDLSALLELLGPVALLHDIGKTKEDKGAEGEHPLTHKVVRMRHPVVSLIAALETLPDDQEHRDVMLALVEEHDTPFSWYIQFRRSGQIPQRRSWTRLDRRIESRDDGTGLVLLAVFKLADIDGHENMEDVPWFMDQAYSNLLREKAKWIPVPDQATLQRLAHAAS